MKPQWIHNTFIGPFWMGSAQEVQKTQEAIDEATHEITDKIEEHTSTETGETHYDEEFPQDEAVACQTPILDTQVYRWFDLSREKSPIMGRDELKVF